MRLSAVLVPLTKPLSARSATSPICQCGYTVDGTYFTSALETDFLHIQDLSLDTNNAWIPQAYNVTPSNSAGPYGKPSQVENVIPIPIKGGSTSWQGPGENGADPGLQPWVRKPQGNDKMISISEIVTSQSNILYGSFRIALEPRSTPGTCTAFFFYHNDTSEIDMEFLSRQTSNKTLNLVIHSPSSFKTGYATGQDFSPKTLPFEASKDYNEFRFDWFPEKVMFFANGVLLDTMTENIPKIPGKIHVSHWSDGNEGWSGGPPGEDAVLTVSYVKAYFNISGEGVRDGEEECAERCVVPDQMVALSLVGENEETVFFTPQGVNDSANGGSGGSSEEGSAVRIWKGYASWFRLFVLSLAVLSFGEVYAANQ